jgi:hypothetical protein
VSPEFVIKSGPKGGTIDFLIDQKIGGGELLGDSDRLDHMKRLKSGGQYFSLIESGNMKQYIVLDFTRTPPKRARPGNILLASF